MVKKIVVYGITNCQICNKEFTKNSAQHEICSSCSIDQHHSNRSPKSDIYRRVRKCKECGRLTRGKIYCRLCGIDSKSDRSDRDPIHLGSLKQPAERVWDQMMRECQ